MSRRLRVACAVALAVLGTATSAWAAGEYKTVEVEGLRVTLDAEWVGGAALGYVPFRWDITNLSKEDREIEIAGDTNRSRMYRRGMRYGVSQPRVRQRIQLAAGDHVRFTMAVPVSGENDNIRFQIREDGRTLQAMGFFSTSSFGGVSALIVFAKNGTYSSLASGWVRSASRGGYLVPGSGGRGGTAPGGPPLDQILEPARLPTSWLGYTSVQAVVVGPREWEQMDAAQRNALLTWTAGGGNLILADADLDTAFPDPSASAQATADRHLPTVTRGVAEYFFGRIHLLSSEAIQSAGFADTLTSIENLTKDQSWVLPVRPVATGSATSGFRLPIPGVEGVPAGAYLTILTLFAVLIGPINFIVLRRRQQQALIVLTTPLIALVFIVLLGGYVIAVEGFGVRGRVVSLTVLDQMTSQAATRSTVSLYAAGRAPSGGLRFPRDVAVFPTPIEGAPPVAEVLDLSEQQQFSSGLLIARSPTNFETLGFRAARERLVFSVEDGRVRVSNGLGATVNRLRFRDRGRSYVLGAPLRAGAAATLDDSTTSGRELLGSSDSVMARFDSLVTNLRDGSYFAVLDRSPFSDTGLGTVDERNSFHAVLGRVSPPAPFGTPADKQ